MKQQTNFLAFVKGEEKYIFLYTNDSVNLVLAKLGVFAGNKDLSFSWYDAAVLSQKIRQKQIIEKQLESVKQRHFDNTMRW